MDGIIPLVTSSNVIPLEKFWLSLFLYHDRPHLINRRLAACQQILYCKIEPSDADFKEIFTKYSLIYEFRKNGCNELNIDFLKNVIGTHKVSLEIVNVDIVKNSLNGIFISLRILLGRDSTKTVEVVILDKNNNKGLFLAAETENHISLTPPFRYQIELSSSGQLRILLDNFEDADSSSAAWLADKLFPKLLSWQNYDNDNKQDVINSLNLISSDTYVTLYNGIKRKYGPDLVKNWSEKTDPKKYVYEDLAIATYLICLWLNEDKEKIHFVDCGCGNGLLVHVLNQEGYKGFGVDVRPRKIWDKFPQSILKIDTVDPDSVFKDCNWIIGNHSDELTPWIPIIALKSSPETNFFVLPCCSYDFNGKKYVRTNTNVSQYCDYVQYVKRISLKCGFDTEIDKLRIPSTKRICLVGKNKNGNKYTNDIEDFINSKIENGFKARDSIEKVRNCTQLPRSFLDEIIKKIVEILLKDPNFINDWNRGAFVSLSDLCKELKDDTKMLKKECGGLQTLLKNHRYLFELKDGTVGLRLPLKITDTDKYRNKKCWYFYNHPNGCLHDDDVCGYSHRFSVQ